MTNGNNRLAQFIDAPGGITAEAARERAEARLGRLRERSDVTVSECIERIGAALSACEQPTPELREEMYRMAYGVANLAGTFDRPALGQAAYSLCALLDDCDVRNHWDRVGVHVHHDALRMLQSRTLTPPAVERLLAGLDAVRKRCRS
ncbi:hypothetical protein [Terricaulis sp.]|uniref:hypothetical protein n=1 Tax=Terricaulis sp. TaxID=2768686 RepID=UPI003783DA21